MTTHAIALITDSTSDIPADIRRQYDIQVVPLYIIWGDEQLRDRVDIEVDAFYQRLSVDRNHPRTSQPSPGDFLQAYEAARDNGAKEIVVITISSALSGTFQSAKQAAAMTDIPVHLHDSRSASMGLGWQVIAAAEARAAGRSAEEMVTAADRARRSMVFIVTLNTLDYLHKGGRINSASRFFGTMLNIKPQIYIDHETGLVEAGERTRTRKKSLENTYNSFFNQVDLGKKLSLSVLHNDALSEAQDIAFRIRKEYHLEDVFISTVSPVLGVHTGPQAIALCGYTTD